MEITFVNGNNSWKFHDDTMTEALWKMGHRRTDIRAKVFLKLPGGILKPDIHPLREVILLGLWFKDLRPVLRGFVVTMHEGACKSTIPIITRYFSFHPVNVSIIRQRRILCSKREPFRVHLLLFCHMSSPNDAKPHNTCRQGMLRLWRTTSQLQYRRVLQCGKTILLHWKYLQRICELNSQLWRCFWQR